MEEESPASIQITRYLIASVVNLEAVENGRFDY
jgi:hypothetical protein